MRPSQSRALACATQSRTPRRVLLALQIYIKQLSSSCTVLTSCMYSTCIRHVFDNESPPQFVWHAGPGASRQGDGAWASSLFCMRLAPASLFCMRLACVLSWSKAGIGIEGRSKATRSEGDDLEESAARAFMRHGGRGRGGRG